MAGKIWIALYKPHQGKELALKALIAEHYPILRRLELITNRPGIVAKSKNGTYLEIAEWQDETSAKRPMNIQKLPRFGTLWEPLQISLGFRVSMKQPCRFPILMQLPCSSSELKLSKAMGWATGEKSGPVIRDRPALPTNSHASSSGIRFKWVSGYSELNGVRNQAIGTWLSRGIL